MSLRLPSQRGLRGCAPPSRRGLQAVRIHIGLPLFAAACRSTHSGALRWFLFLGEPFARKEEQKTVDFSARLRYDKSNRITKMCSCILPRCSAGYGEKEWTYSKELCARGPLRSAKAPGRKTAIAGNREKVGAARERISAQIASQENCSLRL